MPSATSATKSNLAPRVDIMQVTRQSLLLQVQIQLQSQVPVAFSRINNDEQKRPARPDNTPKHAGLVSGSSHAAGGLGRRNSVGRLESWRVAPAAPPSEPLSGFCPNLDLFEFP
jgi:hypothetical protein